MYMVPPFLDLMVRGALCMVHCEGEGNRQQILCGVFVFGVLKIQKYGR
jgi:hypothetical protein